MPLTIEERQQFLAEPHIAALSVAGGPERAPLTVPMWYQYTPGGEAWVLTGATSTKARLIQAAGRFTLMVDRVDPTLRYVMVEGSVTRADPGTDEHLLELSRRYLPAEAVPGYVEVAKAEHGEQVVIHLRPERWLLADLGPSPDVVPVRRSAARNRPAPPQPSLTCGFAVHRALSGGLVSGWE